ncbi:fimbrial biogenesis outer membrane usher protein, partial [Acinetobacter baumannii]
MDINIGNIKDDENKISKDSTRLFLNVFVNSTSSNDLISVNKDQDEKLYIRARDLKTLRLKLDEQISDSQWVCINDLKGIQFKYL